MLTDQCGEKKFFPKVTPGRHLKIKRILQMILKASGQTRPSSTHKNVA